MSLRFAKAHGHGNDFLLVEAGAAPPEAADRARRLCDRHTGIGADGVLLYDRRGPDRIGLRLVNPAGSEAEISANGLRCLAAWAVPFRVPVNDLVFGAPPLRVSGPLPVRSRAAPRNTAAGTRRQR